MTSNLFPRLWAPLRPLRMEAPWPYIDRLCSRNGVEAKLMTRRIKERRADASDGEQVGLAIAEMSGVSPEHWATGWKESALGMTGMLRGPFDRQPGYRVPCRDCAAEANGALTYMHMRFNACIEHGRWTGAGVEREAQALIGDEWLDAEQRYRDLVSRGRVDQNLWERIWRLIRDSAFICAGPQMTADLAAAISNPAFSRDTDALRILYPTVVQALETAAAPEFVAAMNAPGRQDEARRTTLYEAFEWLPGDRWLVCEGIETYYRRVYKTQ